MLCPPKKGSLYVCLVSLSWLLGLLFPTFSLQAASISYLIDVQTNDVLGDQRNLSALTWQLPNGLLIVDRLTAEPGQPTRFGEAIQPRHDASEWFLVSAGRTGHSPGTDLQLLPTLGTIHVHDESFYVVEIPVENLDAFTQFACEKSHLPMTPPPPGWDRSRDEASNLALGASIALNDIEDFVSQIDPTYYNQILQAISGATSFWHDGTEHTVSSRYYNTSDKELVANYLAAQLEGYGYDVTFEEFYYNSHQCRNIIATKAGSASPSEIVVLGGHYDSTSPVPTQAPGAEDNGSGTALIMEVARIAANRQFERSIQFVLFDSEEQGLNGSYHYVDMAVTFGRDIIAAVIADMVSWYNNNYAVIIEGDEPYEWLMTTMQDNVTTFTPLDSRKDYYSWGSDHVPFQQAGIASFLAIDWDWNNYPHYHQVTDTWSNVAATAEIASQIARACAATVADVAGLLPVSTPVTEQTPAQIPQLSAFPNPFNPQVSISFTLPSEDSVRLVIYDLVGRRLATLHDGFLPAGEQTVIWDGRDAFGKILGSGTYLCRLETPATATSLKLNLAR